MLAVAIVFDQSFASVSEMKVYVNNKKIELPVGMKVRHALIKAGLLARLEKGVNVYDEWGNELGLDGALNDGMKLSIGKQA